MTLNCLLSRLDNSKTNGGSLSPTQRGKVEVKTRTRLRSPDILLLTVFVIQGCNLFRDQSHQEDQH